MTVRVYSLQLTASPSLTDSVSVSLRCHNNSVTPPSCSDGSGQKLNKKGRSSIAWTSSAAITMSVKLTLGEAPSEEGLSASHNEYFVH